MGKWFRSMLRATILAIALISVVAAPVASPASEPVLVEVHRDTDGLTVMGRFHGPAVKRDFIALLNSYLPRLEIIDLSGATAADPGPEWGLEMELAALATAAVDDAQVQIGPGQVKIVGTMPDQAARQALSDELLATAGPSIGVELAIRVPPKAIVPFEFSVIKTLGVLRVENCAVRNADDRERIREALARHGAPGGADVCREGLGGPPDDWAAAAVAGLDALEHLSSGQLRLSYLRLWLEASGAARKEDMDAALAYLEDHLPTAFQVRFRYSGDNDVGTAPRDGYWLLAEAEPERLRLEGRLPGEAERDAFVLFARALFPRAQLDNGLTIGTNVPPRDWFISLQTAIRGLSELEEGSVRISSDGYLNLQGVAGRPEMAGTIYRDLREKLPGYRVNTSIDIDLPAIIAAIPLSQEACLAEMNRLIGRRPIKFEQGVARIAEVSRPILNDLVALYRRCEPARLNVVGFTDSSGRKEVNLRISQNRAEAVMDALVAGGIPHKNIEALGKGEASPIADNDTPEGRRLNRRVEFHPAE